MKALVRAASLTRFAEVATECALDPRALVAEAGLPFKCLEDPDLLIPAETGARLLELAAERAREPAFGLRMAESRRLSNLGPLGLLVRDEPSLRHALQAIVANIYLHNEALQAELGEQDRLVTLRVHMDTSGVAQRQAIELALGVAFRILRVFLGSDWRPRLVCFTHPAPARVSLHRSIFGPAVEFGHLFNGIVCNAADLDAPNPGADPVMSRYTQRLVANQPGKRASATERVRALIIILLPRHHCRVEIVSQHLGVQRRTLARHLAAEGTDFGRLVDGVRRDLLSRYFKEGTRPLGEIAVLLGFASPSAFSRWHRNQFGATARAQGWKVK